MNIIYINEFIITSNLYNIFVILFSEQCINKLHSLKFVTFLVRSEKDMIQLFSLHTF